MEIVLARIDDSFINGQIANWSKYVGCQRIILCDDDEARNMTRANALKRATPAGITSYVVDLEKAVRVYENPKYTHDKCLLIFTNPNSILYMVDRGVLITSVNIGRMSYDKGKRQITDDVFMDEKDIQTFKKLSERGVELEVRKSYNDSKVFLTDLLFPSSTTGINWICPKCGKKNTESFCTKCGNKKNQPYWTCPSCGKTRDIEEEFCGNCGTSNPNLRGGRNETSFPSKYFSQSNPQLSKKLFDEGLALKRIGDFKNSIQKYKESIRVYKDDPELNSAFYALGKVLYLDGQYQASLEAYQCYFYYSIVPQMVNDFKDALGSLSHDRRVETIFNGIVKQIDIDSFSRGSRSSIAQLVSFFSNPCVHFGHALLDPTEGSAARDVIQSYRMSLMGKPTPNDAWRASQYTAKCMYAGLSTQCTIVEKYIEDRVALSNFIDNLAARLISL